MKDALTNSPADYAAIDALALKAQTGDKAARELLCLTFKPLLLRQLAHFPRQDQDDALQDLWVAFLEATDRYDPARYQGFAAYIKGCMTFESLKMRDGEHRAYRGTSVVPALSLDEPAGEDGKSTLAEQVADTSPDVAEQFAAGIAHQDSLMQLAHWIAGLPNARQRLIVRGILQGKSLRQIAREQGVAIFTVTSSLQQAVRLYDAKKQSDGG